MVVICGNLARTARCTLIVFGWRFFSTLGPGRIGRAGARLGLRQVLVGDPAHGVLVDDLHPACLITPVILSAVPRGTSVIKV